MVSRTISRFKSAVDYALGHCDDQGEAEGEPVEILRHSFWRRYGSELYHGIDCFGLLDMEIDEG